MTYALPPDLVVILGLRTILSVIGLTVLLTGFWMMEKRWDDQGSSVYDQAQENATGSDYRAVDDETESKEANDMEAHYTQAPDMVVIDKTESKEANDLEAHAYTQAQNMVAIDTIESKEVTDVENHYTQAPDIVVIKQHGGRDLIRVATEDVDEKSMSSPAEVAVDTPHETADLKEDLEAALEAALPVPKVMLAGFAIWALSFLFHAEGGRLHVSGWNISCIIFVVILGYLIAYPIRIATIDRDLDKKKRVASLLVVSSIWLSIAGMSDKETDAPWYFCLFGVLLCLASHHLIRRSRKMGASWDLEGRPDRNVVLQSLGTTMLVFGIFLFWVGTNAVLDVGLEVPYIPIYTNYKAVLTFVAAFVIIIPSLLALDLAFDEGSEPVGYSLDGRTFVEASKRFTVVTLEPFARLLETPIFFITGWVLLGLCSFMPFGGGFTWQKLFTCIIPIIIGGVYALLLLPAYWNSDVPEFKIWRNVYYGLMVLLFTSVGVHGGALLIMSMFGVFFVLVGQHLDMLERKKGAWWLQCRETNPDPTAFGVGQPIYLIGWILLCLSISIPI